MKSVVRALGLTLLLAAIGPSIAAAQTTYPMVCRGAASLAVIRFLIAPGSVNSYLYTYVNRGTAAFSFPTLQPGYCTWLDRGIGPGEPSTLVQVLPGTINTGIYMGVIGTLPPITISTGAIDVRKAPYFPLNANARYLDAGEPIPGTLFDPDTYYTFDVYNNGSGLFVIKSIRCAGVCS